MTRELAGRSWITLSAVHARWVLRTTWRNGEQLLLLVGIPLAALFAISRTDLLSTTTSPLVITAVMVVLAAGFTSPAITLAFERRYGSFAFLGTTPLPRSAIVAGSLGAILIGALVAIGVIAAVAAALGGVASTSVIALFSTVVLGLCATVPWAFVLGGTVTSETVLVLANGIFVLATLFGGVLIPASSLPYGGLLEWLPTGALVELATSATITNIVVLLTWAAVGTLLAVRWFRWR